MQGIGHTLVMYSVKFADWVGLETNIRIQFMANDGLGGRIRSIKILDCHNDFAVNACESLNPLHSGISQAASVA